MAGIRFPLDFARAGEGLAGARGCPNRSVGWPASEGEGGWPAEDSCEEVTLPVAPDFFRPDLLDGSFIDNSRGDQAGSDQIPRQPTHATVVAAPVHLTRDIRPPDR